MLRLRTEIWVQAYIRVCFQNNAPAMVVYKGDADAGAIYIKINRLDGSALVYGPAPFGLDASPDDFDRKWCVSFGAEVTSDAEADQYVSRQREMDRDVWVIEVEDREGRHFLGDAVVELG